MKKQKGIQNWMLLTMWPYWPYLTLVPKGFMDIITMDSVYLPLLWN